MTDCWDFVIANEKQLKRIVEMSCNGRHYLTDDLWASCVMDRVEGIFATYDPNHESGASLKTHMFASIKLYIYKYMGRQARGVVKGGKRQKQLPTGYDQVSVQAKTEIDIEVRDLVQYTMGRLSEYDNRLLRMYIWDEMTFKQMSDELGYAAEGTARLHYMAALTRAKSIVQNCR